MPLFGRRSAEQQQRESEARAEAEATIASLRAGSIPVPAQRRLDKLRQHGGLFTSDLSVNEFLLAREAGIRPISQVMGSSVYHVGWQSLNTWSLASGELTVLSNAINTARDLALARLAEEARRAGGDVVLGVHLTSVDIGERLIEYQAIGTAATVQHTPASRTIGLTNLPGQDFWKLYRAGYWPLGVVAGSTVYHAIPGWGGQMAMSGWGGWYNQELTDFTQGLYAARHLAMRRVSSRAESLHAAGVVGVRIDQHQEEYEIESAGSRRTDMVFTFHVVGTAIANLERGENLPAVNPIVDLRS